MISPVSMRRVAFLACASCRVGLMATMTMEASTPMMPITRRSSISVNPYLNRCVLRIQVPTILLRSLRIPIPRPPPASLYPKSVPRGWPSHELLQIQRRIFLRAVEMHFEVRVDSRLAVHEPGVAHVRDPLAAGDRVAFFHEEIFVVTVECDEAVAVIDLDDVTVSSVPPVIRAGDRACLRGIDCPPAALLHVEAVVTAMEPLRQETGLTAGLLEHTDRGGGRVTRDGWLGSACGRCGRADRLRGGNSDHGGFFHERFSTGNDEFFARGNEAVFHAILSSDLFGLHVIEFSDAEERLSALHRVQHAIDGENEEFLSRLDGSAGRHVIGPANGIHRNVVAVRKFFKTLAIPHDVDDAFGVRAPRAGFRER